MKKFWKDILIGGIIIILIIPLFVALMTRFRFIITDTSNGWIGFWGNYFGAIIGGVITLFVMRWTLENNRKSDRRKEKIEFCYKIAELVVEYADEIMTCFRCIKKYVEAAKEGVKDESYDIAIQKTNSVSRLNSLIVILLEGRVTDSEYRDIGKLNKKLEDIAHKCEAPFARILEHHDLSQDIEELEIEVQNMVWDLNMFMQEFAKDNF